MSKTIDVKKEIEAVWQEVDMAEERFWSLVDIADWPNRDYNKIRNHCKDDVQATSKLFDRLKDYIVREDRHDSPF